MTDQSHLDDRYFVDPYVYNCPFCNRRHVSYIVSTSVQFNWSNQTDCYVYFVTCHSCNKVSMHLSKQEIPLKYAYQLENQEYFRFSLSKDIDAGAVLDSLFFYSVPTSFFVLDERVPSILRELLTEAEGCLKSNFLTGASACARKLVYELAKKENATGDNYDDRLKSLKINHPEIPEEYFDTLLTIQQVTSTKVHENSYDGWKSEHVRLILASLAEVLRELYVLPAQRRDRRESILDLKQKLMS